MVNINQLLAIFILKPGPFCTQSQQSLTKIKVAVMLEVYSSYDTIKVISKVVSCPSHNVHGKTSCTVYQNVVPFFRHEHPS